TSQDDLQRRRATAVERTRLRQEALLGRRVAAASDAAAERVSGVVPYLDVLRQVHEELDPRTYLEVGVRAGSSLALARCPAIGIDPVPEVPVALPAARVIISTSDAYFESPQDVGPIDFAFIDGMHLFEYGLRDFMHIEERSSPTTLVAIDDIYPNHPRQAARSRSTRIWTGDIWKLMVCLKERRRDLLLLPLDSSPTGILLVAGLDHAN